MSAFTALLSHNIDAEEPSEITAYLKEAGANLEKYVQIASLPEDVTSIELSAGEHRRAVLLAFNENEDRQAVRDKPI